MDLCDLLWLCIRKKACEFLSQLYSTSTTILTTVTTTKTFIKAKWHLICHGTHLAARCKCSLELVFNYVIWKQQRHLRVTCVHSSTLFKMWYLLHNGYRCCLLSETVWVRALKDVFLFVACFLNCFYGSFWMVYFFRWYTCYFHAIERFLHCTEVLFILSEVICCRVFIRYPCYS